jgi:GNAT superfamily N-acetyltransferase
VRGALGRRGTSGGVQVADVSEATDADRAEIGSTAVAALRLDPEAAELPDHLARPPAGRRWVSLTVESGTGVVCASLGEPDAQGEVTGYIDLLAVHPRAQGRGLGRALAGAAEEWLRAGGAAEVRFAGHPPCYAWPGIDMRYTPALCLAERLGYERYRMAWNMTAPLDGDLALGGAVDRLAAAGVQLHAVSEGDRVAVAEFARRHWHDNWAWEIEHATGCHYATNDNGILGFAAWGARPGWFGPMGTAPGAEGLGIGRVLLRRCLVEQRDAGQREAQIGWVGPLRFYSRAVGARVERVFALYRRRFEGGADV